MVNISNIIVVAGLNLSSGTMNTIRNINKTLYFVDQKDSKADRKTIDFDGEMIK